MLHTVARAAHAGCAGLPGVGACAVILLRDAEDSAAVAMHGNNREIGRIALTVMGMALTKPRPDHCAACADAWDRMSMAHALLRDIASHCA